jgi:hypothetical protein
VAHRLGVAGGSPDRVHFQQDALDAVYDASHGVPRLINRICDRALHRVAGQGRPECLRYRIRITPEAGIAQAFRPADYSFFNPIFLNSIFIGGPT